MPRGNILSSVLAPGHNNAATTPWWGGDGADAAAFAKQLSTQPTTRKMADSKPTFKAEDFTAAHLKKATVNAHGGVDPK